jgi:hypothetical protein
MIRFMVLIFSEKMHYQFPFFFLSKLCSVCTSATYVHGNAPAWNECEMQSGNVSPAAPAGITLLIYSIELYPHRHRLYA